MRISVPCCIASRSLTYFSQRSDDIKPVACPAKDESSDTTHLRRTRTYLGQSRVRIVASKRHAVLGARGEHSVYDSALVVELTKLAHPLTWFLRPFGHKIINHDPHVSIRTGNGKRWLIPCGETRVNASNATLCCSFLVPRCPIDLPGEKQPLAKG